MRVRIVQSDRSLAAQDVQHSVASSLDIAPLLPLICGGLFLISVAVSYLFVKRHLGGHFVYCLDDAYIHLALAQNIAHGHYGTNPTEFTSPSSSLLWPFLLVPFAKMAFYPYVPLLWNALFGFAAACLIGWVVAKWPPQVDSMGRMLWWKQLVTAVLLMFVANLLGLTFTGMEHVLQILLAVCCAIGLIQVLGGRPMPAWCIAAAIVAPAVRYENLALTVAVCCSLVGLRQWKTAVATLMLGLTPLIGFAIFLHHLGLPLLPLSVLIKGHVYRSGSALHKIGSMLGMGLLEDLIDPERLPMLILSVLFVGLALRAGTRVRRGVFGGAAIVGLLQLLVGRFGWFYRYEVYALIFLVLIYMRVLSERPRFLFGYFVLGLVFCASPFLTATEDIPRAAKEIYVQQFQMHRFTTAYYHGDFAVNDLGLASFNRTPGTYVLDVWGLGSLEASHQVDKTAAWLAGIVQRHGVHLAILYPEWFDIPTTWTPVAKMCNPSPNQVVVGHQCVVFYSTTTEAEPSIRAELKEFSTTVPKGVKFYFDPPRSDRTSPSP